MCCAQGVTNITMAELPTMPLTPDVSQSASRNEGLNLLADLLTARKSASRNGRHI